MTSLESSYKINKGYHSIVIPGNILKIKHFHTSSGSWSYKSKFTNLLDDIASPLTVIASYSTI